MTSVCRGAKARLLLLIALLLLFVGLAIFWKLHGPADAEGVAVLLEGMRLSAGDLPIWAALSWVLAASVVAVPLGAIIVVAALLFGPLPATLYVLSGAALGATISYAIGDYLGHEGVRRFAGERLNRVSQRLAERGLLSVIVIRMLPIAPFAIVNMIAGASHLKIRDFILGTLVGMLPGTLVIAYSIEQLQHWLID